MAWGEDRYEEGAGLTNNRYTGQRAEGYGLYFYQARWYDSALGRFAQADSIIPIQTQGVQAWDRYAYVNNAPCNNTDPDGRFCIPCAIVGVGIIAAITIPWLTGDSARGVDPANPITQAEFNEEMKAAMDTSVAIFAATTSAAFTYLLAADIAMEIGVVTNNQQIYTWGAEQKGLLPSYSGYRQASRYLQEQGVPPDKRKLILQSFRQESIRTRQANYGENVYRYFGEDAQETGSWFTTSEIETRDSLAILEEWNSMAHMSRATIRPGTTIIEGIAAPQGPFSGGAIQYYIHDISSLTNWMRIK